MKKLLGTAAVGAAALVLSISTANASIVLNGGFDEVDPTLQGNGLGQAGTELFSALPSGTGNGSWSVYDVLPGPWVGGDGGIEVQTKNTLGLTPQSGNYYVELDTETEGGSISNSLMYQDLGTLASGRYELSFWYSARTTNTGTNAITASIQNGVLLMEEVVNSDALNWTRYAFEFVVAPGTSDLRLTFKAGGTADEIGGLLDSVSIAAVPLPLSGLLLLGGLGGLAASRKLRRRADA
jgi:hypothetical protein